MEGNKETRFEFISIETQHQSFIFDQNQCTLCGTELAFRHHVDYQTLKVQENAHCASCGIRLRVKEHGLH